MTDSEQKAIFSGVRIVSGATLAGRILGMVRDMAMASSFGLSVEGVMDVFVVAFHFPNLSPRLFGEGALTASYLPVITAELKTGGTLLGNWPASYLLGLVSC